MLLQMQGVFAEYERALIQERTRRGRLFAARQGRVNWGSPPYEVVASFWVDRRDVPRLWGTPGAADERGAVRKMAGLLGESIGRNAHDQCMFCTGAPAAYKSCVRTFLLIL
jgi:hypothetical protein